jgi:hypothetical protein
MRAALHETPWHLERADCRRGLFDELEPAFCSCGFGHSARSPRGRDAVNEVFGCALAGKGYSISFGRRSADPAAALKN